MRKNRLNAPSDLAEIVHRIEAFVLPVLIDSNIAVKVWDAGKGWSPRP
jgi:hypothetical protein